ncbi:MAG TPA: 5'/3'-nucleotidase SurE [Segetibacter sp.]|nr:5'/3'-nucleotidase SurE [Segetibacter sp.]
MTFAPLSKAYMAKAKKAIEENEDTQLNTSTKLKPGQGPQQPQQDTKVKAAKESKTAIKDSGRAAKRSPKEEPIILITNDDGVTAPGIAALVESVKDLGKIVVIAPDKAQSGMGHAITIGTPLRMVRVNQFGDKVEAYSCNGTPVDCVKLAVDKILHRRPDICLSGVNHGANHSINVIYSGTMSAALEAAIESIPSVGFSLLDYSLEADFTGAKKFARLIVEQILSSKSIDKHLCLNVNFPAIPVEQLKGLKICRQAYAKYEEDFAERVDPTGKKYYWLTGDFVNFDKGRDTDVWALNHNYASVVPVQFDLTNYKLKEKLEQTFKLS